MVVGLYRAKWPAQSRASYAARLSSTSNYALKIDCPKLEPSLLRLFNPLDTPRMPPAHTCTVTRRLLVRCVAQQTYPAAHKRDARLEFDLVDNQVDSPLSNSGAVGRSSEPALDASGIDIGSVWKRGMSLRMSGTTERVKSPSITDWAGRLRL